MIYSLYDTQHKAVERECLRITLPSIVLSVVPEGTTSDRVDDDEKDEENDVEHSHPLPVTLDVV